MRYWKWRVDWKKSKSHLSLSIEYIFLSLSLLYFICFVYWMYFLSLFNQILITLSFSSSLDVICSYISEEFDNSTPDPHIISTKPILFLCQLLSTHKKYTWPHTYWRIDCISRPNLIKNRRWRWWHSFVLHWDDRKWNQGWLSNHLPTIR